MLTYLNIAAIWYDNFNQANVRQQYSKAPKQLKDIRSYLSYALLGHWTFMLGYIAYHFGLASLEHLFMQLYHSRILLKTLPHWFIGSFIVTLSCQAGYRIWKAYTDSSPLSYKIKEITMASAKLCFAALTLLSPHVFGSYFTFSVIANGYLACLMIDELAKMAYQVYERVYITHKQIDWSYVLASSYFYGSVLFFLLMLTTNFINPLNISFSIALAVSGGLYNIAETISKLSFGSQTAQQLRESPLKQPDTANYSMTNILKGLWGGLQLAVGLYLWQFGFISSISNTLQALSYAICFNSYLANSELERVAEVEDYLHDKKHQQQVATDTTNMDEYIKTSYQYMLQAKLMLLPNIANDSEPQQSMQQPESQAAVIATEPQSISFTL